ncbi:hypothetical protein TVAG_336990 [Trichomonas vaginalis G3]|uniref:Uncharacterized protein n=1 Tax=Trichomonas vaginalis (strain ATCC PRA-98 / G3) TaxID=412133 RepID=A2EPW9_TRIV3|nr:hypothetical protein TVAGG3_0359660 [Trichomonas vaginalis G3]EAY05307.1 hypothetical protein TVAG_336990 [Trichomonas vaginalis G3]KAI5531860.1 hypothetical protein TVAGG3_0359660 [Trichomonas vaginalis G3]|eukprot:XP_001317530.1 hypothetical protein [Trichomonas vaginalis G3]
MNLGDRITKDTNERNHKRRRATKSDAKGSFSLVERSKSLVLFPDINSFDKNKENCSHIINSTPENSIITNQSNINSNLNPQNESPRSPTLNKSNSLDIINIDVSSRNKTTHRKDPPLRPVDSANIDIVELQKEEPVKNPTASNIDIDHPKENPAIAEAPGLTLEDDGNNVPEQKQPKKTKRSRKSRKAKKSSESNNEEEKVKSQKRRRKLTRSKSNNISSPPVDKKAANENDLNASKSPNAHS